MTPRKPAEKPRTIAVSVKQGGPWVPFSEYQASAQTVGFSRVYAVLFDDGSIWNCSVGWTK